MERYRLYKLAEEFNVDIKTILQILKEHNINKRCAIDTVDDNEYNIVRDSILHSNSIYSNKSAREMGYKTNKEIKFKYFSNVYLEKFRSFKNREIKLGNYFTLITGKNGTMKSSILGLIAHPFSSPNNATDLYGNSLKTEMKDVFKLSLKTDNTPYKYYLGAITKEDIAIEEPIRLYPRPTENRHRVTVGMDNSPGLGNFALNTSYLNLKRLFPIIDTSAHSVPDNLTQDEHKFISDAYSRIMQRNEYSNFETISDQKNKNTCAPKESFYDYNSISSGEDNLGAILYKMIAFMRYKSKDNNLQGIFCIDELEASLHPVAQKYLLDFLYYWAKKNHMQIIATTHSLFLVEQYLNLQNKYGQKNLTLINISTQQVGSELNYKIMTNPDYKIIYKELTYHDIGNEDLYKVHILCEDDMARKVIYKIIKSDNILGNVDFITNISGNDGTSWANYFALIKNAPTLLKDSVVIVDPDVNIEKIKYDYLSKIPDPDNVPIEKRIVYYIYHLDGADDLFSDIELMARQADIHECHISFDNFQKSNITPFKNWSKKYSRFYNKALTRYIHDNISYFDSFRNTIINMINDRRVQNGLPKL